MNVGSSRRIVTVAIALTIAVVVGTVVVPMTQGRGASSYAGRPTSGATSSLLPVVARAASVSPAGIGLIEPTQSWGQFQGNSTHNGAASSAGPLTNAIAWTYSLGGAPDGLITSQGLIVASNPGGSPYLAINESYGVVAYTGSAPGGTADSGSTYAAAGDGLFFGEWYSCGFFSCTCDLGGNAVSNGGSLWATGASGCSPSNSEHYSYSAVAYDSGSVFYVNQGGSSLQGYAAPSGTASWTATLPGALTGVPTVGDGIVLVGYSNLPQVTAISEDSGVVQWTYVIGGDLSDTPSYAGGAFYFGTTSDTLTSVSANGILLWNKTISGMIESTPVETSDLIYVGTDNGFIYALNRSTGAEVWSYNTGISMVSSPALSGNGILYEASTNGVVYALNASTGAVVWEDSLGTPVTASPVLDGGRLFLVTSSGTIYAFGPSPTYSVTFSESGLPLGENWSVTLNGVTEDSTGSPIVFSEPNGAYEYTVADVPGWDQTTIPYTGSVTVSGSTVTEPTLEFTQVTYSVTFTETGLPSGSSWSVTLNGIVESSVSSDIAFTEPNGTYSYSVQDVSGWHQNTLPYAGSVTVSGAAVTEPTLEFAQVTYSVTFTESEMPALAGGGVSFDGSPTATFTIGGTVSFQSPNGTYSYTVTAGTGYQLVSSNPSSPVTVSGAAVTVSVVFEAVYSVTFSETGLPSGTEWYVNITGGPSFSSTTGAIAFTAANGTYAFTIGSVTGYTTSPQSGSVTVRGASPSPMSVSFTLTPTSPSSSGLPFWIYAVIAVVIIVIVVAVVVVVMRRKPPAAT